MLRLLRAEMCVQLRYEEINMDVLLVLHSHSMHFDEVFASER